VLKPEQRAADETILKINESTMDLEYLMRRYGDQVLRLAFSYLGDEEEAKDAAQEVFIKVFTSLEKFEGKSSPYTWIYRITVNHCRDRLRKRNLFKQQTFDASWVADYDLNTEKEVMDNLEKKLLFEAVMSLPVSFREVIILYYLYQFDIKKVAEITGLSSALVKIRLYRGRQRLKKILKEKGVGLYEE